MGKGRFKDTEWDLSNDNGKCGDWQRAGIAVLMDIRDELKKLNALLHCHNFVNIPRQLDPIARMARRANTNAARRRKAAKA